MHRTRSLDYGIILAGEVAMVLVSDAQGSYGDIKGDISSVGSDGQVGESGVYLAGLRIACG